MQPRHIFSRLSNTIGGDTVDVIQIITSPSCLNCNLTKKYRNMNISINIIKHFEDVTCYKLKTYGLSDFDTTYEYERELAQILSDSTSGFIKPDEIYFEEQSIKTAFKNWKEILRQKGIMPASSTVCNKQTADSKQLEHTITIPESQLELIISRFYSLLDKIAEFNDCNKISDKLSTYDTCSKYVAAGDTCYKYVAAGLIIMGVIGIICCITIGWLRTNTDKQDSIKLNATLDEQYQKCVKENECEFETANN